MIHSNRAPLSEWREGALLCLFPRRNLDSASKNREMETNAVLFFSTRNDICCSVAAKSLWISNRISRITNSYGMMGGEAINRIYISTTGKERSRVTLLRKFRNNFRGETTCAKRLCIPRKNPGGNRYEGKEISRDSCKNFIFPSLRLDYGCQNLRGRTNTSLAEYEDESSWRVRTRSPRIRAKNSAVLQKFIRAWLLKPGKFLGQLLAVCRAGCCLSPFGRRGYVYFSLFLSPRLRKFDESIHLTDSENALRDSKACWKEGERKKELKVSNFP